MGEVVLGFFLGLIGAAFGAWVADFFRTKRRNERLRRALVSELLENRTALFRRKRTRLHRSAWDAARAMPMDDSTHTALAAAYVALDRVAVLIDVSLTRSAGERAGSFEEVMKTGGPIAYASTIRRIEAALLALGVTAPGDAETDAE